MSVFSFSDAQSAVPDRRLSATAGGDHRAESPDPGQHFDEPRRVGRPQASDGQGKAFRLFAHINRHPILLLSYRLVDRSNK